MSRPNSAKCLGERFQDAFLAAWGQERGVAYADLPAEAQAKWNRAAVAFVCTLSDAPSEAAARIAELEGDLKTAFREISKLAREAGEAKGRLEMSEAAGIVDGWRERAERAEAQCRVLEGALRVGIEALSGHACHIGPSCPCIRSADQCAAECGREAGDALLALRQALSLSGGGGREEKGSLPESPSADTGPYPRSHDDQHSDGEWRRPPYIFHSLSACAGCGCSGDYFPAPDAAAYEATGELYCDECAEEAVAQALGNQ